MHAALSPFKYWKLCSAKIEKKNTAKDEHLPSTIAGKAIFNVLRPKFIQSTNLFPTSFLINDSSSKCAYYQGMELGC